MVHVGENVVVVHAYSCLGSNVEAVVGGEPGLAEVGRLSPFPSTPILLDGKSDSA